MGGFNLAGQMSVSRDMKKKYNNNMQKPIPVVYYMYVCIFIYVHTCFGFHVHEIFKKK